jgi:septal ring-binding cell division protein DamX
MVAKHLKSLPNIKRFLWCLVGILLFGISLYVFLSGDSGNNTLPQSEDVPAVVRSEPASDAGILLRETEHQEPPSSLETITTGDPGAGPHPGKQDAGSVPEDGVSGPEKVSTHEDEQQNVIRRENALHMEGGAQEQLPKNKPDPVEKNINKLKTDTESRLEIQTFPSPESFVLSLPENLYTIQLMGADDRAYLINVSKTHKISREAVCFQKKNGSTNWHVLIYKTFTDRSEAMACVENLPLELKANGPWIRKIADIQREIAESGI